jgi:hypothetical protein
MATSSASPEAFSPINAATFAAIGSPRCAFVTGGPREYLPGINCVASAMRSVGSAHPLLVMVERADEALMRARVELPPHPSSAVLGWAHFPLPVHAGWQFRSAHVMDKLSLFGMWPFRRLVWVDADVLLRRNVDELCDLPDDVEFASALDGYEVPGHCWPHRSGCGGGNMSRCLHRYNRSESRTPYVGQRARELSPSPAECPYVLQTGVMVVAPLSPAAFNARIVAPVRSGAVHSYGTPRQPNPDPSGLAAALVRRCAPAPRRHPRQRHPRQTAATRA